MSGRPLLAQYPHLRQILKNDPIANQQFQQALAGSTNSGLSTSRTTERELARLTLRIETLLKDHAAEKATLKEQGGIIKLLGEAMEPQVHLRPYTQDIAEDGHYEVKFTAHQVREILRIHWHLIAMEAEAIIRGNTTQEEPDENE